MALNRLNAALRMKAWTRARFALAAQAPVFVTEVQSGVPGFPPVHTVVSFWDERSHYHFTVFKPLIAVREEDLPPSWYQPALAVSEGGSGCTCC